MRASTCNMMDCLRLLALATLVKLTECTSLLDDNPLNPNVEAPLRRLRRTIDTRHVTPMHEQDDLYKERALGTTGFLASSSSSCQEECKTLRCEKLCTCLREKRCQERDGKTKRRRCKNSCKRKVRQWIKEQKEANKSRNVSFGRQFPSSFSVFRSLETDLIKYALPSFNYSSTVTSYTQCPDLQKDIEAAAALLVNAFIVEQATIKLQPFPRNKEPPVGLEIGADVTTESVIDEDSYKTNNQEEGVDEADIIKSDGTVVFAAYGHVIVAWNATNGDILSRTTMPLNAEERKGSRPQISSLLLANGNLVATISSYGNVAAILSESGTTQLRVYDVSAGSIPADGKSPLTLLGTKDVRGRYITARSIGDIVYVASMSSISTYQFLTGPLYRYDEKFASMNKSEYVEAATKHAVELIPKFAALLIEEIASDAGENCRNVAELAVFASSDEPGDETNSTKNSSRPELFQEGILKGYFQITTFNVTEYASLGNATHYTTSAFFPDWDAIVYSSTDAIVAAGRGWWQDWFNRGWYHSTYLMTFRMDKKGGPAVGWGTGRVPGGIKDQYSMDERNGYLRVATTSREQIECILPDGGEGDIWSMKRFWCEWRVVANATSQLTVLRLPDGENKRMEEVATVGNLGVTEEIKSVRFFDDQVFIVTFRRTDPLYAIDLKNPKQPFLAGELKITGFSSYLHEYPTDDGSKILIGVGQDADEKTGQVLGLMVSLFNVTVLSAPTLVQRYVFDKYSFSGAEWDPYGFRFLGESKLLLLPLTINDNPPFDGFTIMNMTIDVIKPLFNVSMAEPDRISNWCWSCTTMPPRSLVFRGHATFVKGHSFKSVDLSASVAKGSEEVRWANVLDPPNLKKDACCDYWPLVEEGGIVLDAKSSP